MIMNPSAHTMIPRKNSFRQYGSSRVRQRLTLPGGKQLWCGVAKVSLSLALLLLISSVFTNGSTKRMTVEIETLEARYGELVNVNNLLQEEKKHLFSLDAVGARAGNQLAIHIPASGQHRKFEKSTGVFL